MNVLLTNNLSIMREGSTNLIVYVIVILMCILDILKNLKDFKSEILMLGILSYFSILIFYFFFLFYPLKTAWLVSIALIGGIPNIFFWYFRTTKGEKGKEALLFITLLVAGIIYYAIQLFP